MSLFFRLLFTVLTARFRARAEVLGPCRTRLRVWPGDIDPLLHVNNGVYLSMLDVARVDLFLRARTFGLLRARRLYPVVAAQTIRYRRSLRLFEGFAIETRIVGWDDHAFLLTHHFLRNDEVVAEAVVRWRFLKRGSGKATSAEVLELLGVSNVSPALPPFVAAWNEQQRARSAGDQGSGSSKATA
ncbi:MAG TPA: acyl-CoA thioesterase [Polyangiaceae bacterium]